MSRLTDNLLHRRVMRHWSRAVRAAETVDLQALRALRGRARELRARLDQVLYAAETRLALPPLGNPAMNKPLHCDWAYRPELWRGPVRPGGLVAVPSKTAFGAEVTVFHDCAASELTLRQLRNRGQGDLAPFGLQMDVFRFDGSFLSLVVELPETAVRGLERRHLVRLAAVVEAERKPEIFARLNIKNGPNVEQIVRELPGADGTEQVVEFDLAYTKLNEKRVERMWLDLIFEGAEMNQIVLRDVTLTRRPRAEI